MWEYNHRDPTLRHAGVKGMHWGKRKAVDDTSPAKKSTHRLNIEEKYKAQGLSQKEAEDAASKRIKTEKVIAITAGLTIAAAGAYMINKNVKARTDGLIKAGTNFQVIAGSHDKDLDRAFYAAYEKGDRKKYGGILADTFKQQGGAAYKVNFDNTKNIKVVSQDKAAETFKNLYKNDSEFRDLFKKSNEQMGAGGPFGMPNLNKVDKLIKGGTPVNDKQLKKLGYEAFNIGLVNHSPEGSKVSEKFYEKLKEQGYHAVMDINDKKFSGYDAKAPVIIFDTASKFSTKTVSKMVDADILASKNKAMNELILKKTAKDLAPWAAALTAGAYGTKTLNEIAATDALIASKKTGGTANATATTKSS